MPRRLTHSHDGPAVVSTMVRSLPRGRRLSIVSRHAPWSWPSRNRDIAEAIAAKLKVVLRPRHAERDHAFNAGLKPILVRDGSFPAVEGYAPEPDHLDMPACSDASCRRGVH